MRALFCFDERLRRRCSRELLVVEPRVSKKLELVLLWNGLCDSGM